VRALVSAVTSEESDSLVTYRAVPATYEPMDRHSKECRRLQAVDSYGKGSGVKGCGTSPQGLVCSQMLAMLLTTRRGKERRGKARGGWDVGEVGRCGWGGIMGEVRSLCINYHNVKIHCLLW
jgi:hypothetical protein